MAKVVSKAGRPKVRGTTNIEGEIKTKPIPNYRDIVCPLNEETRCNALNYCWLVCGLACAEKCYRAPDLMCEGCPCGVGEDEAETN